jgi:universal stress protein E
MTGYEQVLYVVDSEQSTSQGMRMAIPRARAIGAAVTFASILPAPRPTLVPGQLSLDRLSELCTESEAQRLDLLVEPLRGEGVEISTRVLVGDPAEVVIRTAVENEFGMIWKSPSDVAGLRNRFLGGTDMRLIRACPRPVAIVGDHRAEDDATVTLAAVDIEAAAGRDEVNERLNHRILELARLSVMTPKTEIHVVHAWTLYGESVMRSPRAGVAPEELAALLEGEEACRRERLEQLVQRYAETLEASERDAFQPNVRVVRGEPSETIPQEIDRLGADLVVIGTVGRSGMTGFLMGNTVEKILDRISCSVLTTKPDDFVCPISFP